MTIVPRARRRVACCVAAVLAVSPLTAARPRAAADRTILILTPSATDDRLEAALDAVTFWNATLGALGVARRLGPLEVVVDAPVTRALENYARRVVQRAIRLPAGDAEPDAPDAVVDLEADIVVLLSRQDITSFTWPLPRVTPARYLLVIRSVRGPDRADPMVSRHVIAHEIGHALGLLHNDDPNTLMCGPCQPLTAEPDATGYLPLTDAERGRLRALDDGS